VKRVVFASLSQHQGQPRGPHATLARSAAGGFSFRAHVHNFFSHSRSYGLDMASPFRPVRSVLEISLIF